MHTDIRCIQPYEIYEVSFVPEEGMCHDCDSEPELARFEGYKCEERAREYARFRNGLPLRRYRIIRADPGGSDSRPAGTIEADNLTLYEAQAWMRNDAVDGSSDSVSNEAMVSEDSGGGRTIVEPILDPTQVFWTF